MKLAVVWFKRDLRLSDHAPLTQAVQWAQSVGATVLGAYLLEPSQLAHRDMARQHLGFALETWVSLSNEAGPLGLPCSVLNGEAVDVFSRLKSVCTEMRIYSHEETGHWESFQRDIAVRRWCDSHAVQWIESPNNAVVRRLSDRDRWSAIWAQRMQSEPLPVPVFAALPRPSAEVMRLLHQALDAQWLTHTNMPGIPSPYDLADSRQLQIVLAHCMPDAPADKLSRQRGGHVHAWELLQSFASGRGRQYRSAMSSPITAESACSRISPHLAIGSISIRQAAHWVWAQRAAGIEDAQWRASLKSFESRLHWHCHFIQKLESEPQLEWRNAHRLYDGLRNEGELTPQESERLQAWAQARTGVPMIDACMRMLQTTGWVNFRMRAMLVSFASYHLWLHWTHTAPVLAQHFLDYEPGIHYPQFQMQSGVTGINTIRIYNPVKQALDQDPEGEFIARWIPELAHLPPAHRAAPWLASEDLLGRVLESSQYPMPIVDVEQAGRDARDRVWAVRKKPESRSVAAAVYEKHGSRNPQREGRPAPAKSAAGKTARVKRKASPQGELDFNAPEQMDLFSDE